MKTLMALKACVVAAVAAMGIEALAAMLPSEYQEVAYVESDGKQWVDTGYKPNASKTGVVMHFNSGTYGNNTTFFGTGWSSGRFLLNQQSDKFMFHGSGTSLCAKSPGCDMTVTITPDGAGNGTIAFDNPDGAAWKTYSTTVSLSVDNATLKLFGCTGNRSSFRLYRFTITELDEGEHVAVHDFVPCYRRSDKVIGLYDILAEDASTAFKTSGASDPFTLKGEDVFHEDLLKIVGSPADYGEVSPAYGSTNGLAVGDQVVCTASEIWTNDAQTIGARCVGYKVYTNDIVYVEGESRGFTYEHPDCEDGARLVWQWEADYFVTATVPAAYADHVTVSPVWVENGGVAELSVVCDESCALSGTSKGRVEDGKVVFENVKGPTTLALSFEPIVYVKPDGDDARDGLSWANAKRSVAAAVTAAGERVASSGDPARVQCAEGVYLFAASIAVPDKVSIFGGYVVADGSRDTVNHPTIFCGDTNGDDTWSRKVIYGTLGAGRGDAVPVISDGRINVLPVEGCERMTLDTGKMTDNCKRCLILGKGANTIDGITITGFSQKGANDSFADQSYGTAIYVMGGCVATVNDVHLVGNYFNEGGLMHCGATGCLYSNCVFEWNAGGRGAFSTRGSPSTVADCVFRGNSSGGHSMVYLWAGSSLTFTNCWFELGASGGSGQYSPAGAIAAESAGSPTITHCVFTNNWCTGADSSSAITIQNVGSYRIENCLFTHNRTVASGLGNKSVAAGPINVRDRNGGYVANCTFVSNTVEIASTTADALLTAAPIAVYSPGDTGTSAPKFEVVNCTFDGNGVTATNVKDSAVLNTASAIALYGRANGGAAQIGVAGSVFSAVPGLPAIRSYGFNPNAPASHAVNSVFAANDVAPVSAPNGQPIEVEKCVMGAHFEFDPSIGFTDCTEDDPLIRPLEAGTSVPFRRVGARLPDLCDTYDVAKNANSVNFFFLRAGQWERLVDNGAAASSPAAIPDAAGAARPTGGAAMRGAVEGLPDDVAAAKTVVFRTTPAAAGSIDGATTQVVGEGGEAQAITAVPTSAAMEFKGWSYSPDGTPFSTEATLRLGDIGDDAVVYAVYKTPKITYTFNLGECGTFDETGTGHISKIYDIGDTPAVPPHTLDEDGYVILDWDQALPSKVGTEEMTFTMRYNAKVYRIVRYDSAAEDGGDGESWATAMNDLQAAIDKAGIWHGEVWVKKGVHKPANGNVDKIFRLRAYVKVLGGFAGEEDETAADRDPVKNVTVLSGDTAGDDYWQAQFVRGGGWTALKEEDGATNLKVVSAAGEVREPDEAKGYWRWTTVRVGTNVKRLFVTDDALEAFDENTTVEGFAIVGYTSDNIYMAASAHPLIRDCVFIGGGTKINLVSWATVVNCKFLGGGTGIYTASTGPWTTNAHIEGCLFSDWSDGSRGVLAMQGGKADLIGCRFTRNEITGNGYGPGATLGCEQGTAYAYGCLFDNNRSTGSSGGWITKAAIMSNCVVRCNLMDNTGGTECVHVNNGTVWDTTFFSNVIVRTATAAKNYTGSLVMLNTDRSSVYNCTFADNRLEWTPFEGATTQVASIKVSGNCYGGVINCTFVDNDFPQGDFHNTGLARGSDRPTFVVNCLFRNAAKGTAYRAVTTGVQPTSTGGVKIYDSTIPNFDLAESGVVEAIRVDARVPQLSSRRQTNAFGQIAYPVGGPDRKNGTDVCVGANRVVAFNAAAKGETPSWLFKFGSDGGASNPLSPIADIFGAARPLGKMARGSSQLTTGGFALRVR